jgi:hypothetical protein
MEPVEGEAMKKTNRFNPAQIHWTSKSDFGWRINYGRSSFLLCEGSGWSRRWGEEVFRAMKQGPVNKKGKRRK